MAKTCGKCEGTDFTPGGRCRACQRKDYEAYKKRHAGGGSVKTRTKAKNAKPAEISAPTSDELVIEQGYGLTAKIDEDYLIVTQHDGETGKDDAICLSRSELRQIIGKFGGWASKST